MNHADPSTIPTTAKPLLQSPLRDSHERANGKLVPFAGWELPVQFAGLIAEHQAVRQRVGIFDVSHMGELVVSGRNAAAFLDEVTCNHVSTLKIGQAVYNAVLNEQGGVVDDIIVYREAAEEFFLCVNASNVVAVMVWLGTHVRGDVQIENVSDQYGQIAVQGPRAREVLASLPEFSEAAQSLGYFRFARVPWGKNGSVLVARTGYTGEDGVELFIPWHDTETLWERLAAHELVTRCGLGARDTLRLEAAYPLHGHELGEGISALESGLAWITKFEKTSFIGKSALQLQKTQGIPRRLIGFEILGKGIARHGDEIIDSSGNAVGIVTSGTLTPTVQKAIGLALVPENISSPDSPLTLRVRGRTLEAKITKTPFYSALVRKKKET